MQITGNGIDTGTAPKEWFTGTAYDATSDPHVTDEHYGASPSIEEA